MDFISKQHVQWLYQQRIALLSLKSITTFKWLFGPVGSCSRKKVPQNTEQQESEWSRVHNDRGLKTITLRNTTVLWLILSPAPNFWGDENRNGSIDLGAFLLHFTGASALWTKRLYTYYFVSLNQISQELRSWGVWLAFPWSLGKRGNPFVTESFASCELLLTSSSDKAGLISLPSTRFPK